MQQVQVATTCCDLVASGRFVNRKIKHFSCVFDPNRPPDEVIAVVGNIELTRATLRRLMPARWALRTSRSEDLWLNDDIINAFLSVLPVCTNYVVKNSPSLFDSTSCIFPLRAGGKCFTTKQITF